MKKFSNIVEASEYMDALFGSFAATLSAHDIDRLLMFKAHSITIEDYCGDTEAFCVCDRIWKDIPPLPEDIILFHHGKLPDYHKPYFEATCCLFKPTKLKFKKIVAQKGSKIFPLSVIFPGKVDGECGVLLDMTAIKWNLGYYYY